jgi:hypothetical protein
MVDLSECIRRMVCPDCGTDVTRSLDRPKHIDPRTGAYCYGWERTKMRDYVATPELNHEAAA